MLKFGASTARGVVRPVCLCCACGVRVTGVVAARRPGRRARSGQPLPCKAAEEGGPGPVRACVRACVRVRGMRLLYVAPRGRCREPLTLRGAQHVHGSAQARRVPRVPGGGPEAPFAPSRDRPQHAHAAHLRVCAECACALPVLSASATYACPVWAAQCDICISPCARRQYAFPAWAAHGTYAYPPICISGVGTSCDISIFPCAQVPQCGEVLVHEQGHAGGRGRAAVRARSRAFANAFLSEGVRVT